MMKLIQREEFTVRGLSVRTTNRAETRHETAKIPRLWQEFASVCAGCTEPTRAYGVYSDYDADMYGEFTVTAALPGDFPHRDAREVTIPAGTYLCFEGSGPCPATVIALWQKVWEYFAKGDAPARTYRCDFEEYIDRDSVAVFIGITNDKEKKA